MFDPEFELMDLYHESEEIFNDFYNAFLRGDLEYLEKFAGEAALAISKTEFKLRKEGGWEHECQHVLDSTYPIFQGSQMVNGRPRFTFSFTIQEIGCRIDSKTGEIVEGHVDNLLQTSYMMALTRHEEPDIATTGHYWEVTEFQKIGEVAQLV